MISELMKLMVDRSFNISRRWNKIIRNQNYLSQQLSMFHELIITNGNIEPPRNLSVTFRAWYIHDIAVKKHVIWFGSITYCIWHAKLVPSRFGFATCNGIRKNSFAIPSNFHWLKTFKIKIDVELLRKIKICKI